MEKIDPQKAKSIGKICTSDIRETVTTHGVIIKSGSSYMLAETDFEYGDESLPISINLRDISNDIESSVYALVRGKLRSNTEIPSYSTIELTVDEIVYYSSGREEYATNTSKKDAHDVVLEVLSSYPDPVPRRFTVEEAISREIDRSTAIDVLERMENSGGIYSPNVGFVGTVSQN